jgi:phage-related tail fiber protein
VTFKTIHTAYGLRKMAEAEAAGAPINLTHIAVGDGNGLPVEPDELQIQLVRERYRAPVNRVYQDPEDLTRYTAELVIPAAEGGFTLREVGVFDADGGLFVVGNLPDTYKPASSEGAYSDTILRLEFAVTNAVVVTLFVDPNVAVASQTWVANYATAETIIPGGTVGQLLGKATNADGDYEWQSPDAINVTVDTIAEKQLLAAGQTIVDLSATTTYGLAVYIDGLRIDLGTGAGEWQPDAAISTRLHLGQSYAAGTRITLVNNEPAGSAPAPLERAKNLSDVISIAAARTNLDVFSKAETRQMAPPGLVAHFARDTAPTGWLKANGAAVSRVAYAELFAAIGTTFGAGNGFTTFNLPDMRGEFVRGWDDSRGIDGGRSIGSTQSGETASHSHGGAAAAGGDHAHSGTATAGGAHNHAGSTGTAGSHAHGYRDRFMKENYKFGGEPDAAGLGSRGGIDYDNVQFAYVDRTTSDAGEHAHSVSIGTAGAHAHSLSVNAAGSHSHGITIHPAGGAETRPRNIALLACIKF